MRKRNFGNFADGHFEDDVTKLVHLNLLTVASIFHVVRGPWNKIKQVLSGVEGSREFFQAHCLLSINSTLDNCAKLCF